MRVPMFCYECAWERKQTAWNEWHTSQQAGETREEPVSAGYARSEDWLLVDMEDDLAYVHKCPAGHDVRLSMNSMRYEILYESGIVAMLMGFNREAVSSIAAAMERFYEFVVEVFCARSGVTPEAIDDSWKQVANQSERQLGAFLYLYLVEFKRPFLSGKELSRFQETAKFRNGVIHQGKFPKADKVREYAKYVFDSIISIRQQIRTLEAAASRSPWDDMLASVKHRHEMLNHAAMEKKGGKEPEKFGDGWKVDGAHYFPLMLLEIDYQPVADDFDARLKTTEANLPMWGLTLRSTVSLPTS